MHGRLYAAGPAIVSELNMVFILIGNARERGQIRMEKMTVLSLLIIHIHYQRCKYTNALKLPHDTIRDISVS